MVAFGAIVRAGDSPALPGGYLRITSTAPMPITSRGVVAMIGQSNWGPINTPQLCYSIDDVVRAFGPASDLVAMSAQAFGGGAIALQCVRPGSTGTAAAVSIATTVAGLAPTLTLTAKYVGTRALSASLRNSAALPGTFELVIYEAGTPLETINLGTVNTEAAFQAAINDPTRGSRYVTASLTASAVAANALNLVTQVALTGGAQPTVNASAYDLARQSLSPFPWFILVEASEDPIEHATLAGYIDGEILLGHRRMAVAAQSLAAVTLTAALATAASINDPAIIYVANDFATSTGSVLGMQAAAWMAGMVSSMLPSHTASLRRVVGATSIPHELTNSDLGRCIVNGATAFTRDHRNNVMTGKGITTYIVPGTPPIWAEKADLNWLYIDRPVRVFGIVDAVMSVLMDRITDPNPDNRPDKNNPGLLSLLQAGQNVLAGFMPNALDPATKLVQDTPLSTDKTIFRFKVDPFIDVFGVDTVILTLSTA